MAKTLIDLMADEGWLSVAKAADLSGFSRHTIHRLIREQQIMSTRVGKRWFVKRESLAEHYDTEPVKSRILGFLDVT